MKMSRILFFMILFLIQSSASFAAEISSDAFDFSSYEVLFSNQSVLQCGSNPHVDVYTSFDIEILLSISNAISANKISMETDWVNFIAPNLNSVNFNEKAFNSLPGDMKRILFLCLTWNESDRLKLFVVPDEALENIANRLSHERPWKNLPPYLVKKADLLSKETLKYFIYVVLRANIFESDRGGVDKNKSLWFISWDWLSSNERIKK